MHCKSRAVRLEAVKPGLSRSIRADATFLVQATLSPPTSGLPDDVDPDPGDQFRNYYEAVFRPFWAGLPTGLGPLCASLERAEETS